MGQASATADFRVRFSVHSAPQERSWSGASPLPTPPRRLNRVGEAETERRKLGSVCAARVVCRHAVCANVWCVCVGCARCEVREDVREAIVLVMEASPIC